MANQNEKELAGRAAAELVVSGNVVGLGTGSTAYFALVALGERVKEAVHQIKTAPRPGQLGVIAVDCSALMRPAYTVLNRPSEELAYQLSHRASRDPRRMKRGSIAPAFGTEVGLLLVQ